tara:strand:- start:269 stop:457 length:189 start_codon:yes stop_codon:yes gene_type:complete
MILKLKMMESNSRECELLSLLYRSEELLLEIMDGCKDNQDYMYLSIIIKNLEDKISQQQDLI